MTNASTKAPSKANDNASAENHALAVITASSATELQAHAVYLAIKPLARRAYLIGNDHEQWANRPTEKRPIRPFWATMYASSGTNKDGSPKWTDKKKPARAMRAAAAVVLAALNDKFRDKSEEGLEVFFLSVETAIIGVMAPATKAPAAEDADKAADKAAAKVGAALEAVVKAANDHLLTESQWETLLCLAGKAPATKAPASKAPATKAPASKAPATKAPASKAPATRRICRNSKLVLEGMARDAAMFPSPAKV